MPELSQPRGFGDYVVDRELGRGGMGVYAATHTSLGKRVAIKVLLGDVSRDAELIERFRNEARAASAIEHPSIVEIHSVGHEGDAVYIVMELLQGESLAARLRARGALSITDAIGLARQCANALDAAHRVGIIHRDLKPDNVFLVPDVEVAGGERVKLLDFGIAKLVGADSSSGARTVTGAILGTPHYMSPEQCEGAREVDPRSDLYSLGCMLFQMVTGRLPFIGAGVGGLIGMHLHVAPPTLRSIRPDVPPKLDELVNTLLAKAPEDRIQTAGDVTLALKAISVLPSSAMLPRPLKLVAADMATVSTVVAAAPPQRSKRWLAMAGGAGLVLAALVGFAVTRGEDEPTEPPVSTPVRMVEPPVALPDTKRATEGSADPELEIARNMLRDGELAGAEYQVGRLIKRSPNDPAVLGLRVALNDARAARVLEGARKAAAAQRYDDVMKGVEQVHGLTKDRTLVAAADTLWAKLKPDVINAGRAKVTALVAKLACKEARVAARFAQQLGGNYDAQFEECERREARVELDAAIVESLLNRIQTTSNQKLISVYCTDLISRDVKRVPWATCVRAACTEGSAAGTLMISHAPYNLQLGLACAKE